MAGGWRPSRPVLRQPVPGLGCEEWTDHQYDDEAQDQLRESSGRLRPPRPRHLGGQAVRPGTTCVRPSSRVRDRPMIRSSRPGGRGSRPRTRTAVPFCQVSAVLARHARCLGAGDRARPRGHRHRRPAAGGRGRPGPHRRTASRGCGRRHRRHRGRDPRPHRRGPVRKTGDFPSSAATSGRPAPRWRNGNPLFWTRPPPGPSPTGSSPRPRCCRSGSAHHWAPAATPPVCAQIHST